MNYKTALDVRKSRTDTLEHRAGILVPLTRTIAKTAEMYQIDQVSDVLFSVLISREK